MKTYDPALLAALEAGEIITGGAVRVATATPLRVWSGYGELSLSIPAPETFLGIGHNGLVRATGGRLGGAERGIELSLSGVDPDVIPLIEQNDVRGAAVVIWRLMFDSSGTQLLGAHVFARGRIDTLPIEDTPGAASTITARIETAARGLGRATGRMRADADQRMIDATDGGFKRVSAAPVKTLAWGGKPPARAANVLTPGQQLEGMWPGIFQ